MQLLWIQIFIAACIYKSDSANIFENGPCSLGDGRFGICSLVDKCNSIYPKTREPNFDFNSLKEKLCGFKGETFLVCCPDKIITPETPNSLGIRFSEDTIKTKIFFKTAFGGIRVSPDTRKADIACEINVKNYTNALQPNIVNGKKTNLGDFPHMAALIYDSDETPWQCGGALISDRYVLTAAHCFNTQGPRKVILGTNDLTNKIILKEIEIEENIRHPNYKSSLSYFDIGLIRLKQNLIFTDVLRPACLNTVPNYLTASSMLTVIGFGKIGGGSFDPQSTSLLQANLSYIPVDSCNRTFNVVPRDRKLPNGLDLGQICAHDEEPEDDLRSDSCNGDSGGPLQVRNLKFGNTSVIFGIVSVGQFCALNTPTIYTNVVHYLDWIESVVWPDDF